MPRLVDYPHGSFKSALEIATAVDYLGGSCSLASCAEHLNKKIGGSFKSIISSSIKHGLINSKKDILNTTELFRLYKLAYDDQEKLETLRKAFFLPNLYKKIYDRFKGKELPIAMLDKLLIREFGVEESYASRISGYFIDGSKNLKILENGRLIENANSEEPDAEEEEMEVNVISKRDPENKNTENNIDIVHSSSGLSTAYTVVISGPGMNSRIEINEEDDLTILDAMINKIKKKLKEGEK